MIMTITVITAWHCDKSVSTLHTKSLDIGLAHECLSQCSVNYHVHPIFSFPNVLKFTYFRTYHNKNGYSIENNEQILKYVPINLIKHTCFSLKIRYSVACSISHHIHWSDSEHVVVTYSIGRCRVLKVSCTNSTF